MAKSLLTLNDITTNELSFILNGSERLKSEIKNSSQPKSLENKVIGLLFEKPSTRTRTSFESAALRLGGQVIYMPSSELQLGRGEPVKDTARILGGYCDLLVARVFDHQTVSDLAEFSGIPVINGLCNIAHPTQIICDLLTIIESKKNIKGLTLAYIGDGNNVCNSLLLGTAMMGMNMKIACPDGYKPNEDFLNKAKQIAKDTGSTFEITSNPELAVKNADILYTDTWVSMGEENQKEEKLKTFAGYQINEKLLKLANPDAKVMHCLPAYRGLEITDEIMEGKDAIIWQQGENKMYGAIGILDFFING